MAPVPPLPELPEAPLEPPESPWSSESPSDFPQATTRTKPVTATNPHRKKSTTQSIARGSGRWSIAGGRVATERVFGVDHFAEADAARRTVGAAAIAFGLRLVVGALGRKDPAKALGGRRITTHFHGAVAVCVFARGAGV